MKKKKGGLSGGISDMEGKGMGRHNSILGWASINYYNNNC